MTDDEKLIEGRVRLYTKTLHERALAQVIREAKLKGLDWIGPLWVESTYARIVESLQHED